MLHTKIRENRPTGSGEEDFLRVFTIYGRGGHLGNVTQGGSTYNLALIRPAVSEKKIVEHCERRRTRTPTDDGRTDGRRLDGYTISSPCEPYGSGELIIF